MGMVLRKMEEQILATNCIITASRFPVLGIRLFTAQGEAGHGLLTLPGTLLTPDSTANRQARVHIREEQDRVLFNLLHMEAIASVFFIRDSAGERKLL